MIWPVWLICILAALAGGIGFWLVMTFKPRPTLLTFLGLLATIAIPPDVAAGLLAGAWLAEAFFLQKHEGMAVPNESIGWRRVVKDALEVTSAFLVGLIYIFRQRNHAMPGSVLLVGLVLSFGLTLCYFHAIAGDIPRQLRVRHGYAVGLLSFIPWIFLLTKLGWPLLGLGFLTFLLLPPFFLATLDLDLTMPIGQRRRRRRHRSNRSIKFRLPK